MIVTVELSTMTRCIVCYTPWWYLVKMFVIVWCFVVRGCAVSRRYIHVCNCDVFSVVNMYLDHLKFRVVCING